MYLIFLSFLKSDIGTKRPRTFLVPPNPLNHHFEREVRKDIAMRLGNKKEIPEIQFSQLTIPDEVLKMDSLSPMSKLIFELIYTSCIQNNSDKTSDWTIKTLAETLGTTTQNIGHAIKILCKNGLLDWVKKTDELSKNTVKKYFQMKKYFQEIQKAVYNNTMNEVNRIITKLIDYKLKTNNKNKKKSNKEFIHYEVMKSNFEEFIKLIGMGIDYFNSISIPSPSDTSCPMDIGNKSLPKTGNDFIDSLGSFLGKLKNTTTNPKEINSTNPNNSNTQKTMNQRIRERIESKKPPKPDPTPNPLLQKIFTMPNVPRHRVGTKAYQNSVRMLTLLKSGQLFSASAKPEEKWLKQFDIPNRYLAQVWPEHLILPIFSDISKTYTLGYEPADKATLPKSLEDILYNPRSHKSLFLKAAAAGRVRQLSAAEEKRQEKKLTLQEQNVLGVLTKSIESCKVKWEMNAVEQKSLVKAAKELIMEYDSHIRHLPGGWDTLLGFVQNYADWIYEEYSGRLEYVYFGLDSKAWRKYRNEMGLERE